MPSPCPLRTSETALRDLNALISASLQDKNKVGTTKAILYTPLVVYDKANLKNQFCWTLDTIR